SAKGKGVTIAVVDTGVDPDHPDLVRQLVAGRNMIDPQRRPRDENGHGTHVAGIAAARAGNGIGISGAAPKAAVMPIKVLDADGGGDAATIAAGIDWAVANGARVINLSLGGSGLTARLLKGGRINQSIRAAYDQGAVVVAAAGNDGQPLRAYRFGVPVLVVNAVGPDGAAAEFSNYGDARAVAAPGVDIVSTAPTYSSTLFGTDPSGYGRLSGTSMAAPFVAGEAALLLSQGRSAAETVEIIAATARNPDSDPRLGAGVISASAAVASPPATEDPQPEAADGDGSGSALGSRIRDRLDSPGPLARTRDTSGARPSGPLLGIAAGLLATAGLAALFLLRRRR
ncbi:MAG: S8 family serine peptidase, partial [Dermatophilaceae bacterium]